MNTISLSDDFLLRQGLGASWRLQHCQSVDLEGLSSELLDAREECFLPGDWLSRFDSVGALIFVVPLSAYQDQPASASLVSKKSTWSYCIVR